MVRGDIPCLRIPKVQPTVEEIIDTPHPQPVASLRDYTKVCIYRLIYHIYFTILYKLIPQ